MVSLSLVINNLANNALIPIATKVANVYGLSSTYANSPIQISFLVYSLMNFPASHFMDVKGLGFSFRMGNVLYALGLFFCTFINYGYHWVIFGSILVALGQPFIMNSPAKVATFWFINKNVFKYYHVERNCYWCYYGNQYHIIRHRSGHSRYFCRLRCFWSRSLNLNFNYVLSIFYGFISGCCFSHVIYEGTTIKTTIKRC